MAIFIETYQKVARYFQKIQTNKADYRKIQASFNVAILIVQVTSPNLFYVRNEIKIEIKLIL